MKLLLNEMYPAALAAALRAAGVEASTAAEVGLAGRSDPDVFAAARLQRRVLLTENVADFTRLAAEATAAGHHHPGLLIALSSRFSRRRDGIGSLVAAVLGTSGEDLENRIVYLDTPVQGD